MLASQLYLGPNRHRHGTGVRRHSTYVQTYRDASWRYLLNFPEYFILSPPYRPSSPTKDKLGMNLASRANDDGVNPIIE